jgi:L-ribulose-5-phosphate 3-epimerase
MSMSTPSRRETLRTTLATAAVAVASRLFPQELHAMNQKALPKLRKALKFDMIKIDGSIEDKFNLIKSIGFEGVEINSPSNVDRDEAVAARDKTGIEIHGVINSVHWQKRLSDPGEKVRAEGVEAMRTALRDARFYGASTVLLVPGKVTDPEKENFEQVWQRSQAEIRKVLPLATELDVKIAIEVVWNDFITKPEQLVQYVDEFGDPMVGAYFDISNMIKYGVPPAEWIRQLGHRMLKFDCKGYSNERGWVPIGEGDEDWPEVLKALAEINYSGWATAEVAGGGEAHLRDVHQRMQRVLGGEAA